MYTNKRKKIAAVHDLSGAGRVSLTVVIPILSSMGFQVALCPQPYYPATPIPALLFLGPHGQDAQDYSVNGSNLAYNSMLIDTGYLGFPARYKSYPGSSDRFPPVRQPGAMIDPVLGDNGKLYTNFDEQMILEMRHLIRKADVITPNMTELFYLLDKPYKAENTDEELKLTCMKFRSTAPVSLLSPACPYREILAKLPFTPMTDRETAIGK